MNIKLSLILAALALLGTSVYADDIQAQGECGSEDPAFYKAYCEKNCNEFEPCPENDHRCHRETFDRCHDHHFDPCKARREYARLREEYELILAERRRIREEEGFIRGLIQKEKAFRNRELVFFNGLPSPIPGVSPFPPLPIIPGIEGEFTIIPPANQEYTVVPSTTNQQYSLFPPS